MDHQHSRTSGHDEHPAAWLMRLIRDLGSQHFTGKLSLNFHDGNLSHKVEQTHHVVLTP